MNGKYLKEKSVEQQVVYQTALSQAANRLKFASQFAKAAKGKIRKEATISEAAAMLSLSSLIEALAKTDAKQSNGKGHDPIPTGNGRKRRKGSSAAALKAWKTRRANLKAKPKKG